MKKVQHRGLSDFNRQNRMRNTSNYAKKTTKKNLAQRVNPPSIFFAHNLFINTNMLLRQNF